MDLWFGGINGSELDLILSLYHYWSKGGTVCSLKGIHRFLSKFDYMTKTIYAHFTETCKCMEIIFFYWYLEEKYTLLLQDACLGQFRICQKNAFLEVQRGAEAMADLPSCHNKLYIPKLNGYDCTFTSRIVCVCVCVTWMNHSRLLLVLCASYILLENVFSSAFEVHFISYIRVLIRRKF